MITGRKSRIGSERRPNPDDSGELGEQWGTTVGKQDRAFQNAMLLALSRRQERLPAPDTTPRETVPRRPFATAFMSTASNLEN